MLPWDLRSISEHVESEKDRIIASLIPEIDCPEGCALCCEYPLERSTDCDFNIEYYESEYRDRGCRQLNGKKCLIYHNRPLICRVFWKVEGDLPCHGGLRPVKYLTKEQLRRIEWCWSVGTLQDALALKAWMRRES